jgi:hypothetical protein
MTGCTSIASQLSIFCDHRPCWLDFKNAMMLAFEIAMNLAADSVIAVCLLMEQNCHLVILVWKVAGRSLIAIEQCVDKFQIDTLRGLPG